jgi:hypothetical protein
MKKIKQYVPTYNPLPKPGDVRELINRERQVVGLGVVYGILPKERMILIQPLNLEENGEIEVNDL